MVLLKPDGRIDLEHRAYFLRGGPQQSVIVAAAEDGHFSVVSPESNALHSHRLPSKIRAISPHPSDGWLAFVGGDSGSLVVQSLDGKRILEIAPSQVDEGVPSWIKQGFEDCHFDATGKFVWLTAPLNAEDCEVQLIETETGSLVGKTTVKDPFGGSSCSFYGTERPDLVSLWLAAGQDGQQVYWLKRSRKGFTCTVEPCLKDTIPPVFSPNGKRFLVVNEEGAVCQYDFRKMQRVGVPVTSENEDNPFTESVAYLNERQALVSTNEGLIFVVNTAKMKVEGEAIIEGHEPRPIGEYYPTLAKEPGLATDISYFIRLGDLILLVFRRDRRAGSSGWKDSLLWLRVGT